MPLIYSFVARERTVLAEYTPYSGNFKTLAVECLQKMTNPESRFTVACDRHTFNFVVNDGFAYLVVADEAYGRMIPFAFLARVKEEFEENYASKASTAPAHSLDRTFGPRLKTHMEYCMAHPEEISKLAAVQKKVEQVKGVMVQNVEKVLQRGDKIEVLVDKADELRNQAGEFQRKGKMLRSKMWYQNMKMQFTICCLILVLGIVVFLAACFTGNNCLQKKHSHELEDGEGHPPSPESPNSPQTKRGGHDRRLMSGLESAAWAVLLGRL